jgi:hypothetical protein
VAWYVPTCNIPTLKLSLIISMQITYSAVVQQPIWNFHLKLSPYYPITFFKKHLYESKQHNIYKNADFSHETLWRLCQFQ